MHVIPVINCPDADCIRKKLETAKTFLYRGDMVHLDVTDGTFTEHKTWNDPLNWHTFESPFALEVHLMIDHPEEQIDHWLVAGAVRLIVHAETVTPEIFHQIVLQAEQYHAEVMLSSLIDFPVQSIAPYAKYSQQFQVLAVHPGPAGQEFLPAANEKIGFLREEFPNAIIEVDGGVNESVARLVKVYGADTVVSSHFIFGSADPKRAFETLKNL